MIGRFLDIKILFHGGDTGKTNLKNRINVVFSRRASDEALLGYIGQGNFNEVKK